MKKISKSLIGLTLGVILSLGTGFAISSVNENVINVKATNEQVKTVYLTGGAKIDTDNYTLKEYDITYEYSKSASKIGYQSSTGTNRLNKSEGHSTALIFGSQGTYIKNITPLGSRITKFVVYLNKSASTKSGVYVSFAKNSITKLDSEPITQKMDEDDKQYELSNIPADCNYFYLEMYNHKDAKSINTQIQLQINYVESPSVTPEEEAEAWGKSFMETDTALTCEDENVDNSEDLKLVWSLFEDEYNNISDEAKKAVKAAVGDNNGSTYLAKAVARYDHIIARYSSTHTEINDFIGRNSTASGLSKISKGIDNNNYLIVIFTISFISITAVGGYFFLRKRKVN